MAAPLAPTTVEVSWNDAPATSVPVGATNVVLLISPVVVVVAVRQAAGTVITLVSRVTAPGVSASNRPVTLAPVTKVIEAADMMVPLKAAPASKVAELPTCQNTQPADAPSVRRTVLAASAVRVESAWKMYTPDPTRVTVPVRSIELVALYTPGIRLRPPSVE